MLFSLAGSPSQSNPLDLPALPKGEMSNAAGTRAAADSMQIVVKQPAAESETTGVVLMCVYFGSTRFLKSLRLFEDGLLPNYLEFARL